jgi:hypothetical protein
MCRHPDQTDCIGLETAHFAPEGETTMNTKRLSFIITAGALAALILSTGLAAAEPRFEPNRTGEGLAKYQMIKKELIVDTDVHKALDFETMFFLEINTWVYDSGRADFQQADTADVFIAYTNVCQGEGLVSDSAARDGMNGLIETYCSSRVPFLGDRDDSAAPSIPLHPDWPDGGLYDTPEVTVPVPQHPDWPYGLNDY